MPLLDSIDIPGGYALTVSEWAKSEKISYKTAWRMIRRERLPNNLRVVRLPTGSIRLHLQSEEQPQPLEKLDNTVIYARVNPRESRERLDLQVEFCRSFCAAKGWTIQRTVREIAPSVGASRQKLQRLLDPPPKRLVMATTTILSRFDFQLLETCLKHMGCELIVIDQSEEREGQGGALEDLIDAISITCHRQYGFKRGNLLVEMLRKILHKTPM